jgi:hypothetical protein
MVNNCQSIPEVPEVKNQTMKADTFSSDIPSYRQTVTPDQAEGFTIPKRETANTNSLPSKNHSE